MGIFGSTWRFIKGENKLGMLTRIGGEGLVWFLLYDYTSTPVAALARNIDDYYLTGKVIKDRIKQASDKLENIGKKIPKEQPKEEEGLWGWAKSKVQGASQSYDNLVVKYKIIDGEVKILGEELDQVTTMVQNHNYNLGPVILSRDKSIGDYTVILYGSIILVIFATRASKHYNKFIKALKERKVAMLEKDHKKLQKSNEQLEVRLKNLEMVLGEVVADNKRLKEIIAGDPELKKLNANLTQLIQKKAGASVNGINADIGLEMRKIEARKDALGLIDATLNEKVEATIELITANSRKKSLSPEDITSLRSLLNLVLKDLEGLQAELSSLDRDVAVNREKFRNMIQAIGQNLLADPEIALIVKQINERLKKVS